MVNLKNLEIGDKIKLRDGEIFTVHSLEEKDLVVGNHFERVHVVNDGFYKVTGKYTVENCISDDIVEIIKSSKNITRDIRLQWECDGKSTYIDCTVPLDTPSTLIALAKDIALAYKEDECSKFIEVMDAFGYTTKMKDNDVEVYNFNHPTSQNLVELENEDIDKFLDLTIRMKDTLGLSYVITSLDAMVDEMVKNKQIKTKGYISENTKL